METISLNQTAPSVALQEAKAKRQQQPANSTDEAANESGEFAEKLNNQLDSVKLSAAMAAQVQAPVVPLQDAKVKAVNPDLTGNSAVAKQNAEQLAQLKADTQAQVGAQTSAQTSDSKSQNSQTVMSESDAQAKVKDLLLRQASMNTSSAMSGLQPWSKAWVLEGIDPANAQEIKPLLSKDRGLKTLEESSKVDTVNQGDLQKILMKLQNDLKEVRGNADLMGTSPEALVSESSFKSLSPNANARMGSEDFMSVRNGMRNTSQVNPENANQVAGKNADTVQRVGTNSAGLGGLALQNNGTRSERTVDLDQDRLDTFSPDRAAAMAALQQSGAAQKRPPVQLSGQVTRGSMMKERLTTESLNDVSSNIAKFAPDGGGEMRIRLKPDTLGELSIRVSTDRRGQVNLAIQTANPEAKAVLQESLSSLRDKLADKRLSLGKVEFGVGMATASASSTPGIAFDMGSRMDNNPSSYQHQQAAMNYSGSDVASQNGGQSRGRDVYDSERASDGRAKKTSSTSQVSGTSPLSQRAKSSEGRLEVWA